MLCFGAATMVLNNYFLNKKFTKMSNSRSWQLLTIAIGFLITNSNVVAISDSPDTGLKTLYLVFPIN